MKFFELELTAEETASQLKINYKTVVQLFRNFRILISSDDVVNAWKKNNILGKKSELIGIYSIGEKFFFDFSASKTSNVAKLRLDRKRVSDSSAVLDVGIKVIKTPRVKQIFDLPSGFQKFVRFTKERLLKFRGTDRRFLELYLKEIEFRYLYSRVDVFDRLGVEITKNFSRVVR
jgi:transposase-like protein